MLVCGTRRCGTFWNQQSHHSWRITTRVKCTKNPYKVSLQSIFLMFRCCHFKSLTSKRTLLKKVERLRSQCMYLWLFICSFPLRWGHWRILACSSRCVLFLDSIWMLQVALITMFCCWFLAYLRLGRCFCGIASHWTDCSSLSVGDDQEEFDLGMAQNDNPEDSRRMDG